MEESLKNPRQFLLHLPLKISISAIFDKRVTRGRTHGRTHGPTHGRTHGPTQGLNQRPTHGRTIRAVGNTHGINE